MPKNPQVGNAIKNSHVFTDAVFFLCFVLLVSIFIGIFYYRRYKTVFLQNEQNQKAQNELYQKFLSLEKSFLDLKNQDQYKINRSLEKEINNIQNTFKNSIESFEKLNDLRLLSTNTKEFDAEFAKVLSLLSEKNYSSASSLLNKLTKKIQSEMDKLTTVSIPQNIASNKNPPENGYQRQKVETENGPFVLDIIASDLNSTKVIIDTASESDCKDNCPVLSLSEYIGKNNAFAGINGSYFCPAAYPSCSDKKNSFDTLLMNKDKKYFNSENNVYSTIPAVIINGTNIRFVNKSLEWGRDTGVDAVIANYPLLLSDGNVIVGETSDTKLTSKGSRSFIATKGNTIYLGVVHAASIYESALVLKTLGLSHALNLDSGGSTALWANGSYRVGPGRNIPNAILLLKR